MRLTSPFSGISSPPILTSLVHSVEQKSSVPGGVSRKNNWDEIVGVFIQEKVWLENSLSQLEGGGGYREGRSK
jgi:hypothetical protein